MTTTTLPIGDAKLALLNAPDITIGEKDAGTRAGQAFRIQLVQDLTKEMKDHLRHGKAQLVLGTNSVFTTVMTSLDKEHVIDPPS